MELRLFFFFFVTDYDLLSCSSKWKPTLCPCAACPKGTGAILTRTSFHCLTLGQLLCSLINRNRCFTWSNEEQVWRMKLFPPDFILFPFLHTSFSVKIIHFPAAQPLRLEWWLWGALPPMCAAPEHLDLTPLFSPVPSSTQQMTSCSCKKVAVREPESVCLIVQKVSRHRPVSLH